MTVGPIHANGAAGSHYAVYFGDLKSNVYAIDAQTGAKIWKTHVEKHFATRVTAAPALYQGRLYVPISAWEGFQARVLDYPCCTAVGSVSSLDANTGRIIWKTYTIAEPPQRRHKNSQGVQLWGPAAFRYGIHLRLILPATPCTSAPGDATTYPAPATSDAIMALDINTGRRLWTHQIYAGECLHRRVRRHR